MSGSVSLKALGLKATKLPKPLGRCCMPLSVTDSPEGRPRLAAVAGDRDGLLTELSLGELLTAGRQSSEGPGPPVGDADEALRMLVRTATSFSASTLQGMQQAGAVMYMVELTQHALILRSAPINGLVLVVWLSVVAAQHIINIAAAPATSAVKRQT